MGKYTAVFAWPDGEEPTVGKKDEWLGGNICSVAFYDEHEKYVSLLDAAEAVVKELRNSASPSVDALAELLGWEVEDTE